MPVSKKFHVGFCLGALRPIEFCPGEGGGGAFTFYQHVYRQTSRYTVQC